MHVSKVSGWLLQCVQCQVMDYHRSQRPDCFTASDSWRNRTTSLLSSCGNYTVCCTAHFHHAL